ncbi:hypothetical protein K1719_038773 [Acacia pycnantha]|nr:hypothetical protein K1719_038773 [Acacia pycnantha]
MISVFAVSYNEISFTMRKARHGNLMWQVKYCSHGRISLSQSLSSRSINASFERLTCHIPRLLAIFWARHPLIHIPRRQMDTVYRELDDLKLEVEKLKEECRIKTELVESLKNARNEEYLKFQEIMQQTEKQARELHLKSEEICILRNANEDIKSNWLEKEDHIKHLISEKKKIEANFAERLSKLEEVNRELVLTLDELKVKNSELEQNACANNNEISGLRTLLSASQKKYLEAQEKTREANKLRDRDDFIMKLEEENRNMNDKMKWKIEQFRHLEEAHKKLQSQFQSDKEHWEKEQSALLEEITSLQTSLDSQTRTLEAVQSRLEMCNHALAHQESKRKLLEAEISEFKSQFEDVFTQCEEEKSKIQSLTFQRNEEIAELRNSLGEKETLVREMELKIVRLEQENQELGDSLKELREAQIQNAGANSFLPRLRNKLKRLEEAHKDCASTMKSRECQWGSQVEKMEADIRTHKSSLTSKEQEIKDLQMELENCHCAIEEHSLGLLIFKSELIEAYAKSFSAETDKAVQIKAKEDMNLLSDVQLGERELEESSEYQLVLKGQLLEMENTLKYERRVALEAQEKLELELANKNNEITQLGCKIEKWKSNAETLKACSEDIQGKCQKMERSLILQVDSEQALKDENERLICIAKEQERKAEELQKQIALLELYNTSKLKEAETSIKEEKDQIIKHLKELAMSLEQDLMCALSLASSEEVEKWVEVAVLTGALIDAENQIKLEIEEKNLRIMKSKLEVNNLLEKLAYKEESILHLKHESEQHQASLEKKKLEAEDQTEKQRSMESRIRELEFEKGTLLQDITKLLAEKEGMLAHIEDMCEKIGELSGGDQLLMKTLDDILHTSVDGDDWSTDLVDFDKLHVSAANGTFSVTTKKQEANFDERAPLREVNNLHM